MVPFVGGLAEPSHWKWGYRDCDVHVHTYILAELFSYFVPPSLPTPVCLDLRCHGEDAWRHVGAHLEQSRQ